MSLPKEYYENKKERLAREEKIKAFVLGVIFVTVSGLFIYFNN